MEYEIKIHNDYNDSLKNLWCKFEKKSFNHCFQNFYWLKNWYQNLKNKKNFLVCNLLVTKNNELIYIFPFCIEKKYGASLLRWQGDLQADYMNGLFHSDKIVDEIDFLNLWKKIKKKLPKYDLVFFEKQQEKIGNLTNPFVKYLTKINQGYARSVVTKGSFEEFLSKNLKKKFLDDTKRSLNNLNKKGELKFEVYENTNDNNVKKIVKEILDQKILRLKKLKIKNNLESSVQDFYLNFDNKEFDNGSLHISSISFNNKLLSYHWGVVYKKIFYYLMPSIASSELNKYSPGRLLLYNLMKWSFNNEIEKFDFTIGEELYKKNWSDIKSNIYYSLEPNTLISYPIFIILLIHLKLKVFIKKFFFN